VTTPWPRDARTLVAAAGAALGESLGACVPGEPLAERLQFVRDTLRRLTAMMPDETDTADRSPLDLNAAVAAIFPLLQRLVGPFIRLELALETRGAWAVLDAEELEQILVNLVVRARDALPLGGAIRIATRRRFYARPQAFPRGTLPAGTWAMIEVASDRGVSDDSALAPLFDESVAASDLDSGSLFGLVTVRTVVRRVGGYLAASAGSTGSGSGSPTGPTVTVCFPAESGTRPSAGHRGGGPGDGPEAVLVVDPDAWTRTNTAHALRRAGFGVLEADHGSAAFELLLGVAGRCVRLILADPAGVDDGQLQSLATLIGECSGGRLIVIVDSATGGGEGKLTGPALVKPFTTEQLLDTVRAYLVPADSGA
jgi:CheY-like chemotaxis protein